MSPIAVGITLILVVAASQVVLLIYKRRQKAALLSALRLSWGKKVLRPFPLEFEKIAIYHKAKAQNSLSSIDDKTWADLNLDQVFDYLDRTSSRAGQQCLYHRLRTPERSVEPLVRFEVAIKAFGDPRLRERCQIHLRGLSDKDALLLPHLFFNEQPHPGIYRFVFPSLSLTICAVLIVSLFYSAFWPLFLLLACANIAISFFYRRRIDALVQPLRQLNVLISTSKSISHYKDPLVLDQTTRLNTCLPKLRGLHRTTALLAFDQNQDQISAMLYQYLSMIFLIDVNCFAFSLLELRKKRQFVQSIYETLGFLDIAIAVASLRAQRLHTKPRFTERQKACHWEGLVHPLLETAVANDFSFSKRGVLLTGSNMSGKSTFIRTVGVNVILAQTLHTCFATKYEAPFLVVRSSMTNVDDLTEGKSYYLAEVESVGSLIKAADSECQHLFLLDELFDGTNTIERISAARAVLEYLNGKDNLVFVATHDIELVELLGEFECHHFRELIVDQKMIFDYQLRPGTSSTRNAIAILELAGYPRLLVDTALKTVKKLESK